jgi:septal ring factor EnvC (AmiA/AmiB activator)
MRCMWEAKFVSHPVLNDEIQGIKNVIKKEEEEEEKKKKKKKKKEKKKEKKKKKKKKKTEANGGERPEGGRQGEIALPAPHGG